MHQEENQFIRAYNRQADPVTCVVPRDRAIAKRAAAAANRT